MRRVSNVFKTNASLALSVVGLLLLAAVLLLRVTPRAGAADFCAAIGTEHATTDVVQAAPYQTVHIVGSGFVQSCAVTVEVLRPDGSIVKGDGSETPGGDVASTDANGSFDFPYTVGKIGGTYLAIV